VSPTHARDVQSSSHTHTPYPYIRAVCISVGVAIIFADGMDRTMNGLHFAHLLREKCDDVYNAMGLVFPKFHGMPITLKHIEHALCEFQKFISLSKQYEHG
jgi:hypothetical protein